MRRIRLLVSILAFGIALVPSSAIASSTYNVLGVETGPPQSNQSCPAPNSVSSFAGIAGGALNGVFQIGVCHTALGSGGATILGGAFTITNGATTVAGAFAPGGTVGPPNLRVTGSLCIEKFLVSGGLLPSGQFGGKLVHYGVWTGSSCNVFFATISGSATI